MNESSSKFVDKLAIERLINEKLTKVKHSPDKSYFKNQDVSFDDNTLQRADIRFVECIDNISLFEIPSFYKQQYYTENNSVNIYAHPSLNPKGNILLIHGLFDDNMSNFLFLIKQLNELNFNVYLMVLPYHFNRKPQDSSFSGEYFFSADIYRTRNAFKQAVLDVEATIQFIAFQNALPTKLLGFSMGGCVAFRYYLLKNGEIGTFLINPVTDLKRLAWENYLLLSVGRDLDESSLNKQAIEKVFNDVDPCKKIGAKFEANKLTIAYSTYDQIIEKSKYVSFIKRTGIRNIFEYSAGHLNVLRVPRLARDIHKFLSEDTSSKENGNVINYWGRANE